MSWNPFFVCFCSILFSLKRCVQKIIQKKKERGRKGNLREILIDCIFFIDTFKNISAIRTCQLPVFDGFLLGAYGPWAGWDLYRAIPAMTQELCLHGLFRRTAPRLVSSNDKLGYWKGSIWIFMGNYMKNETGENGK